MNRTQKKKKLKRNIILLLTGQTISQFGSSMTSFATIIWAYTAYEEVMASSLLAICSAIPYLIVSLLGGAVADRMNKKKIMLLCDSAAALGSGWILFSLFHNSLQLWILCAVNILNGFMNAFQSPASQVSISLLTEKEDFTRIEGIQSIAGSVVSLLTPVAAAGLLSFGGLKLVVGIDLLTFFFAFFTLLIFIRIPDIAESGTPVSFRELKNDISQSLRFLQRERGIFLLFLMYGILECVGAVSFDSMYSPLLLARTSQNEMTVGLVSFFIASGCLTASILLSTVKPPKKKLPLMFAGSFLCLTGITLFGVGQHIIWWCAVAFFGCLGSPVYQTMQTVLLRERVPFTMQGRIFALRGMLTQMLTPIGYLTGAILADHCLEPWMKKDSMLSNLLSFAVGKGNGAGMGLLFVLAGLTGILILSVICRNPSIRKLDCGS